MSKDKVVTTHTIFEIWINGKLIGRTGQDGDCGYIEIFKSLKIVPIEWFAFDKNNKWIYDVTLNQQADVEEKMSLLSKTVNPHIEEIE